MRALRYLYSRKAPLISFMRWRNGHKEILRRLQPHRANAQYSVVLRELKCARRDLGVTSTRQPRPRKIEALSPALQSRGADFDPAHVAFGVIHVASGSSAFGGIVLQNYFWRQNEQY